MELFDLKEAAKRLGVSVDHVRALVDDGRLRYVNIGRGRKRPRYRFADADLNAGRRSFECQKTQVSQEAIDRVIPAMREAWKGEIPLSPMVPGAPTNDLFR